MGNPKKNIKRDEAQAMSNWGASVGSREKIPEASSEAKQRFFQKLHTQTEVRKHPKTGERMFLMHRGAGELNSRIPHEFNKTSWTPDYKIAQGFATNDDHDDRPEVKRGKIYSAWIPESAIHNYINNAANPHNKGHLQEQEYIVKPHKFTYAKRQKLGSSEVVDKNINTRQNLKQTYGEDRAYNGENRADQEIKQFNKKNIRPSKAPESDKLAASENTESDLNKGSLQSRNKFNPQAKENKMTQTQQRAWTHGEEDSVRETLPKMEGSARLRALNKLSAKTHARKDPSTGERLFLMHRGMGSEEFSGSNSNNVSQYEQGARTSWTPDKEVAASFGGYGGVKPNVVSAWIPESAIIHSPNQFNAPTSASDKNIVTGDPIERTVPRSVTEKEEDEWIVEHKQPFQHAHPRFLNRINEDKIMANSKIPDGNFISERTNYRAEVGGHQIKDVKALEGEDKSQAHENAISQKGKIGSKNGNFKLGDKLAASENTKSDLTKGSLQARNKTSRDKLPPQDLDNTKKWINATSAYESPTDDHRKARDDIGQQPPELTNRLRQQIGKMTELRRHPETGKIHALLHRGMSEDEFNNTHKNGVINHDTSSSWSTNRDIADSFGRGQGKKTVSAWVPLSSIKSSPFLIPKKSDKAAARDDLFHLASRSENELIVNPNHNSPVTNEKYEPKKDTIGKKVKEFKNDRTNREMIERQFDKNKLAASENTESDLKKTISAGGTGGAPSTLTGGAALQVEELSTDLEKPFKSKKKSEVTKTDKISGGLADSKKPSDFDKKRLKAGTKVESEHTSDKKIAQEIAMDHLTEDRDYYKKLKTIEKSDMMRRGVLIAGIGAGMQNMYNQNVEEAKPIRREIASTTNEREYTEPEKAYGAAQKEAFSIAAKHLPLSRNLARKTIKESPELSEAHGYVMHLSPSAYKEVVEKNPQIKQDVAGYVYDKLHKQHGGDQKKIFDSYRDAAKNIQKSTTYEK